LIKAINERPSNPKRAIFEDRINQRCFDRCCVVGHLVHIHKTYVHSRICSLVLFVSTACGHRHYWRGLSFLLFQDSTKEKTMTYLDSIGAAMQRALDWDDIPEDLLPLVIISEVAHLSATDSDAMGHPAWH
jgi:hypothetical protein